MDPRLNERYSRQILFAEIGEAGQARLLASSAVLVGCGALGTAAANLLVRAGVGRLRIVDRDFVEASNLQRQTLFTEADALEALPKAVAAERRLREINSDVNVEGIVADLGPKNAEELLGGFPLLLDGTDNFETRLLLNDVAIHLGVPWIYAAAVASYGVTMTVYPGETACLACLIETEGDSNGTHAVLGAEETCDTVGVLAPAATAIASLEAAEAIRLLSRPAAGPCCGRKAIFPGCLERALADDSRGATIELPRVRAPGINLPERGRATSRDDVRARFGADSREAAADRSGGTRAAAGADCFRRAAEFVFVAVPRAAV